MNDLELTEIAFTNISAKARRYGLMKHVFDVRVKDVDRFFFVGSGDMFPVSPGDDVWMRNFATGLVSHHRIYDIFSPEIKIQMESLGRNKKPLLHTWREVERPSLQVTFVRLGEFLYGDMDIDFSGLSMDVLGFFVRMAEVLVPGYTDHVRLAKKLRKKGYDV